MRMNNLLHYTENHRYCVYRDFCLGPVDHRMLSLIYQPMVGGFAISFYQLLFQQVPLEQVGYSKPEQQRKLFLTLGVDPSEKGRRYLIEQTSKLEAVGLLQSSRIYLPETDDYVYEYELQPPLPPTQFFKTQHLTLLLRDKLGKFAVLSLQEQLWSKEPQEWSQTLMNKENLSVPFYDIFELNTHAIDYELEQAIAEVQISRQPELRQLEEEGFNYSDIILRFPRDSVNRAQVESFRYDAEKLGAVNYVARKYNLSVQDLCRLLDEDGIFGPDGSLLIDELQHRANLHFRQGKRREEERQALGGKVVSLRQGSDLMAAGESPPEEHAVQMEYYVEVPPQLQGKCDVHQYNMMLRNEPHTRLLPKFFPGSVPDSLLDIFEKIDLNYKLPAEVINVLIHYLMMLLTTGGEQRINRKFVESIASNMLLKQVTTYEKAVVYIREQGKVKKSGEPGSTPPAAGGRGKSYARSGKVKPDIPIVQSTNTGEEGVSEEEFAELIKMAQQMQTGHSKGS
ncbi:helicase DnaB [Paenibacillus sp. CAA11]|uniref:DnaD domain protein n=1 Tax=Paenibacillus sp. CAA11 TaxID=1532905 RepID=UPI000D35B1E5|nr:DnaD domain protein [Paenibacillus sp. CAA11]AWB45856.1 helicase DnaB [Paenibacillus sp. CAA11]